MGIAEVSGGSKDLIAEHRDSDRVLYYTLSIVVNDEYLMELQKVADESGVEARTSGSDSQFRLLSSVLSPNFSTGDPINGIDEWIQHVKNYAVSSGEKLPDSMKVTVLLNTVNEPLRTQLQMKVGTKAIVDDMIKMIEPTVDSASRGLTVQTSTKSTTGYYGDSFGDPMEVRPCRHQRLVPAQRQEGQR